MRKVLLSTAVLAGLSFGASPIEICAREPFDYDRSWVGKIKARRDKPRLKPNQKPVKREYKNRHKKGRP